MVGFKWASFLLLLMRDVDNATAIGAQSGAQWIRRVFISSILACMKALADKI